MTNIISLPVLEAMVQKSKNIKALKLNNILFVCVQHLLFTTVSLIKALIESGAKPENIFLIGKHYSYSSIVADQLTALGIQFQSLQPILTLGGFSDAFDKSLQVMWTSIQEHIKRNCIEGIVILDEGGRCVEYYLKKVKLNLPIVGIEQTKGGLFSPLVSNLSFPLIEVASSAVKTHLESRMITDSITLKAINKLPKNKKLNCGIVGIGTIGKSLMFRLLTLGHRVILYDIQPERLQNIKYGLKSPDLLSLIESSDVILGCSGRDIMADLDPLKCINNDKIFISCTSEDKEFLSLLKYIQTSDNKIPCHSLDDICYKLSNEATIHIIHGGFPVNFDHSGESVPSRDIQLTRGLLFGSLIQAALSLYDIKNPLFSGSNMLNPAIQRFVVLTWNGCDKNTIFSKQIIDAFKSLDWIGKHSDGQIASFNHFPQYFSTELVYPS